MSESLEKAVAQKKESIEAAMDMFERGAEVLASAVGELLPLCEAAAPVLRLALHKVQSKEVFYVKEQFVTVRGRLDVLTAQLQDIEGEIRKGRLDARYFGVEENIRNQFRKYLDLLEARPQFREVKTRLFLEHFAKTGGDKNLLVLHDALMGRNAFAQSLLELVESYVARNRRLLEDFCVRMKELLCLGLIALLGHVALTRGPEDEEAAISEWSAKVQEAESRMKSAIAACVAAFPEQAQTDAQRLLQAKDGGGDEDLQETSRQLLDFLDGKYDWVRWSVRLVNHAGSAYRNWRAGERFHRAAGDHWFEVLQVNGLDLVASYSAEPRPVPRAAVLAAMEAQGRRSNAPAAAEALQAQLPGFVVHAVSRHKESAAAWSFPDDCHYWERHKNVAVCVHSE